MNDWDDIRFFLAVAREGSVSGAAKVLGVNHSTVSRRIQGLEGKHGVRLFNRQRDGYEMSESADAIFDQALAIEAQSQQISRTLFGQDTRLEGLVNLTMPHDIFEHCLADELARFRQQHPGIQLNLMVTQGLRNLASREADLAIRLTPSPPDYLVGREVAGLQHGLYAASHIGKIESLNSLNANGPVGVVLWSGEEHLPEWACEHFPDAYIALRVDDLSSMYAAVKAGFGIARMPCYMPDSIADGSIVRLPVSVPRSDWSVWVLNHVDLRKTARVQRCREFLLQALGQKQGLFEGERSGPKQQLESRGINSSD
ncbi:MAG: LysR family transcriptional regulator [Amphritea sp.]